MSAVATRPMGAVSRMSVVAATHVALVCVIANGFGLVPKKAVVPPPILADFVPDKLPPIDEVIPSTQPVLENQIVRVPEPQVVQVETEPQDDRIQGEAFPPEKLNIEIGSARVVPEIVGPRTDPRHPLTRPRYPDQYIRDQIEGAVEVEIYVLTNGRIGDARILRTSGYDAFDRATLEEARRNWRMQPGTRGGEPVAQWFRTRVVFKLTNR